MKPVTPLRQRRGSALVVGLASAAVAVAFAVVVFSASAVASLRRQAPQAPREPVCPPSPSPPVRGTPCPDDLVSPLVHHHPPHHRAASKADDVFAERN
jgi:hypothetical protein